MKKIAFILSLLVFSGGFTSAQAAEICNEVCKLQKMEKERNDANEKANNEYRTNVSNIDNNYSPKISLAESEYNLALSKWQEIDQVKLNNFKPFGWPNGALLSYNFYHPMANSGFMSGTLNNQDHRGIFLNLRDVINFDSCWIVNTWSCPQSNIYQIKEKRNGSPTWDLEGIYGKSVNWDYIVVTVVSFNAGLLISVKDDGSAVSLSEFQLKRSLVKSKYENWKSLQNQQMTALTSAGDELNHLRQAANEIYARSLSEIQWVQYANLELRSNFPATAKNILTKKGYFKPLKTKSYTYETGTYIAEATISGNTATVTGYWETETLYDVPTKKEQENWMKKSQKLYDSMIKKYNDIVYEAKSKQYNVVCAKNTPCKVYF